MKKRRPCTWNRSHSPRNSPRPTYARASEAFPIKSRSFHDPKRRRPQRRIAKHQDRFFEQTDETRIKRNAFGSLESLFDVKKPLTFPEVHSFTFEYHKEGYIESNLESKSSRIPRNIVQTLFLKSANRESHILEKTDDSNDLLSTEYSEKSQELETRTQPTELANGLENSLAIELQSLSDNYMYDRVVEKQISQIDMAAEQAEETLDGVEEDKEETNEVFADDLGETVIEAKTDEVPVEGGDGDETTGQPPPFPITAGVAEGVPIKPGGRRESALSASPLTDAAVMKEMKEADERCTIIAKEINQLKQEVAELTDKKNLTEEDTLQIQEKQEDIMSKLAEFEKITRKLQRLLGLADPSSYTFAKMFGMLPYPHTKPPMDGEEVERIGTLIEEDDESAGDELKGKKKKKPADMLDGDRFDLPQKEYPEDKLPRVIICGYTEDKIPKIVVADSERKGKKKCLQTLTGKLTESLTMQEKLAKENAQLEGGKYKLEEALLEKDTAVESLQRKVCGLQAEMRIVVKENTELSRQLACLNQRLTSPTCCYTCPGGTPSSPLPPCSYASSTPHGDCCRCKCCLQTQTADTFSPSANAGCVNPDNIGTPASASPRLAGGASRTEGWCLMSDSSQFEEMCCRSPATAKASCPGPPSRGTCPAEMENKLAVYGNSTKQLEQQLGSMESEVRNMQMELANVQRERQQLEQQRKLLKCTGPCAPCACSPPPASGLQLPSVPVYMPPSAIGPTMPAPSVPSMPLSKMSPPTAPAMCTGPCVNAPMGTSTCPQQQLRDLREQYARLQDDYKNKLCEVSCLRTDMEKLKQEARDAKEEREKMEIKMIDALERMKILDAEREKFDGSKEQMVEQEQALIVAKQRFREAQDELEELRSLIQDQAAQLEDYRNKYLQAQQQVEEQRRQLDLMEMDNARMNENVTLEIGRVKNQFQEKLAELAPLPDILKQTQVKLQEAQQMRLVAERNCEDLSRELLGCKDKIQTLQNQLDVLRSEHQALQEERGHGTGKFEEMERKNSELRHENERMKNTLARFEEHEAQLQKRIDEKMHEITQLSAMLEQVREDSARQVARTKERCETVRRTMQGQIAEMERQLAQCRATARAAQKDRDEIRQKMQGQINNLNEAFEQAQGRIRSLQGHVNYLKTSYSNIFKGPGEATGALGDTPGAGYDSCDCNY